MWFHNLNASLDCRCVHGFLKCRADTLIGKVEEGFSNFYRECGAEILGGKEILFCKNKCLIVCAPDGPCRVCAPIMVRDMS